MSQTISESQAALLPHIDSGEVRVVGGRDRGRRVAIGKSPIRVGTASDCELALRDRTVSAHHLEIRLGPRGFLLRDLGSRNGTFLGVSRVGEIAVPPGTEIRLGSTHLALLAGGTSTDTDASDRDRLGPLVGRSLAMRRVYDRVERAAACNAPVLITGETGTGKDVTARAIHDLSGRGGGPFVLFDCSRTVPSLISSELFGHAHGAFTGASRDRPGMAEAASGGTLFLDEVGELPEVLQPVLLRLCETGQVQRIGETQARPVDLRIIAATSRDLAGEVRARRFREDLFYRLNVLPIVLPPLRSRLEDLPGLIAALMAAEGATPGPIEGPNLAVLYHSSWPGNVRQLRNALVRGMALASARRFADLVLDRLDDAAAPEAAVSTSFRDEKQRVIDQFERGFLADLMARHGGKIRSACAASGLERTQLKRLLAKHGLR